MALPTDGALDWDSLSATPPAAPSTPTPPTDVPLTSNSDVPLPEPAMTWDSLSATPPESPGLFDRDGTLDNLGAAYSRAVDKTGDALTGMGESVKRWFDDGKGEAAPSELSKIGHGGVALLSAMGAGAQDVANTIGSGVGQLLRIPDAATKLVTDITGRESPYPSVYDWYNRNLLAPAKEQSRLNWETVQQETEKGGLYGEAGAMVGSLADQMAEMVLGGGMTKAPKMLSMGADAARTGFQTARDVFLNGFVQSAKVSRLPAAVEATKAYDAVYQQTGDPEAAVKAGLTSGSSLVMANILPISVEGPILWRVLTGGGVGGLTEEFQRQSTNLGMPADMQAPFTWKGIIQGTLAGGLMGPIFGHNPTENPQVATLRYNAIRDAGDNGNAGAARTASLVEDLTHVDGLNNAAVDAAVHGVTQANATMAKSHDELMASDPRYAAIFKATQGGPAGVDAAKGEQIARDAYANEVSQNAAWDHYTQATGKNNQSVRLLSEAKVLVNTATKTVPREELDLLARWAMHDQPSQLQFNAALRQTVEAKVAPDYVHDRYDADYDADHVMNQQAYARDAMAHPDTFDASYAPNPKVEAALQKAGVPYYRMDDGSLVVRGSTSEYTTAVFAHIYDATGETPLKPGESHEGQAPATTETHGENGQAEPPAGRGPRNKTQEGPASKAVADRGQAGDEGDGAGVRAGDQSGAQGNRSADAQAENLTPRAEPVAKALADAGAEAPVDKTGRVTVEANAPDAQAIMDAAANDAAESARSERRPVTDAEKKRGNYRVGKILFTSPKGNVPFDVENPAGSVRRSLADSPDRWARKMRGAHYGRQPGTISADGEPLDIFATPRAADDSLPIFVIAQHDPKTGKFDEPKVVMGAKTKGEALDIYSRHYPEAMRPKLTPNGNADVVRLTREKYVAWTDSGATDVMPHPVSGQPRMETRQHGDFTARLDESANPEDVAAKVKAINAKHGVDLQVGEDGRTVAGNIPAAKAKAIGRSLARLTGYQEGMIHGQPIERPVAVGAREETAPAQGARASLGNKRGGPAKGAAEPTEAPRAEGLGHATSDAPIFQEGQGAHPVSAIGVHYSNTPDLTALDPTMAGTGSAGSERRRFGMGRFGASGDPMKRVVHFYVREGDALPPKERVVLGEHPYEARLNNLYDVRTDPDGIIDRAEAEHRGMNWDSILEDIHDAGYDGVIHAALPGMPAKHMVTVFGIDNAIPVKPATAVPKKKVAGRAMFVGEKAAGKEHAQALEKAKENEFRGAAEGKPVEQIDAENHVETGWSRGADGKWRYEIDDSPATIKTDMSQAVQDELKSMRGVPVTEVLDHPELFDKVPYMKDVRVSTLPAVLPEHIGALYDEDSATIFMHPFGKYPKTGVDSVTSILLHELQHHAQREEGHATGGSSAEFVSRLDRDRLDKIKQLERELGFDRKERAEKGLSPERAKELDGIIAQKTEGLESLKSMTAEDIRALADRLYHHLAGEQEAYNTQRRQTMTARERRMLPPAFSETVARNAQIVRFQGHAPGAFHEADAGTVEAPATGTESEGLPGQGGVRGSPRGMAAERRTRDAPVPVEGLPQHIRVNGKVETFGPHAPALEAAAAYAEAHGLPVVRPKTYAKVDEERATRIAEAYEAMEHAPNDPVVKAAYKAMIDETLAQWEAIKATGLDIDFIPEGSPDPYGNPRGAILDVVNNNHLWVYPTDSGFGSSDLDVSDNPLLQPTGEVIKGHRMLANDVFRIVHDYFGHIKEGFGFRADGEENAWRAHSLMYSPLARRAMTSETRGQNSWVNFGPFGEANRTASGADTHYADQKVGLLPEWVTTQGAPDDPRGTLGGDIRASLGRKPELFSGMQRALEDAKGAPKQASGSQWKGWLDGAQRRGDIKKGERDWTGIDRWLDEHGDTPVTREEVLSYIQSHTPKIEIERKGAPVERSSTAEILREQFDESTDREAIDTWENDPDVDNAWLSRQLGERERYVDDVEGDIREYDGNETQYGRYKTPGGENYQEHLLTLPGNRYESPHWEGNEGVVVHVRMDDRTVPKGPTSRMLPSAIDDVTIRVRDAVIGTEPGSGLALRGMRREDVTKAFREGVITQREANELLHSMFGGPDHDIGAPSLKVKHIHEVQSDLHQAGRRQGYKTPESVKARHTEIDARMAAIRDSDLPEDRREWQALRNERAALDSQGVPDAPFKQTKEWSMLGIKHAVLEAIRDGSDAIEWDTGATNADRYSLRKVVETLRYNPRNHVLVGYGEGGGQVIREEVVPEKLPDYIGKEAAEKLLASEPDKIGMHVLTGAQLEVGGKGMTAFYDKLLVNEVNQWAKKFGGKVEQAKVVMPGHVTRRTMDGYVDDSGKAVTVHRLMITPAMREAAGEGLPMFRVGAEAAGASDAQFKAVTDHVAKVKAQWKGAPEFSIHRDIRDVPELRDWASNVPEGQAVGGIYHNGKVYLFSDHLTPDQVGGTVLHEVAGHFGLRGTFGEDFPVLLDQIHASVKDTDLYKQVFADYREAYSGRAGAKMHRYVTEEYLARIAEDGSNPNVLKKVYAWVRAWARSHGLDLQWTDNDIRVMLAKVAKNVREGRVSQANLEAAETHFDDDVGMATTTYKGEAGRGTVEHFYDGSRNVRLSDVAANIRTSMIGRRLVASVGELQGTSPQALRQLVRFAGDDGKAGVAIGTEDVTAAQIEASGVPFTRHDGFYLLQTPPAGELPMFSVKNIAKGTPAEEAVLNRFIDYTELNMTPWDRFQHTLRDFTRNWQNGDTATQLKQNWSDALAVLSREERKQNGGLLLDAAESAYKFAWMAQNNRQITAGVLKEGIPAYVRGSFVKVAGHKGMLDILQPLYRTPDGKSLDRLFEGYIAAHRANELRQLQNADGTFKEQLMSQKDIDTLMALDQKYPVFKTVMAELHEFHRQLLDLAVNRGALSPETAALWKSHMYVPFYRSMTPDDAKGAAWATKGLTGGSKVNSRKIYGSERRIEPVIENIIKNTGVILDKIYSNEAKRRIVALMDGHGIERIKIPLQAIRMSAREAVAQLAKAGIQVDTSNLTTADLDVLTTLFRPTMPLGSDIVTVVENGKNLYYRITDPMTYQAMTSFDHKAEFNDIVGAILGISKKVYTFSTTLDPRFMFRIMLKDAMQSWLQTGTNPNMFSGVMTNAKDIWTDASFLNQLRVAGYNGNEYYRVNELRDMMRELHGQDWKVLNTPKKLYHAYHKVGWLSEQLSRVKIAKHVLDNGGSMAEAAWQAQDTTNWQRHGASRAAQMIMRGAPFLNAHIQGLSRLFAGAAGRDVTVNRKRAVVSFMLKSAGIMAASLALGAHNKDDPRFERLPEWAKDLYWHFFIGDNHFVIPKPFEMGAMVGTIPERAMRALSGTDTPNQFMAAMGRAMLDAFGLDPTPAFARPLLEDAANKDFHTGIPIVSESMQNLKPEAQYKPFTSVAVRKLAQTMPDWAPDSVRSPLRLQHLIRGYTSAVGMYMLQMADAVVRATGDYPAEPASRFGGVFGDAAAHITGFSHPSTDTANTYVEQVYAAKKDADAAAATMAAYIKQSDLEDARDVMADNRTLLGYRAQINTMAKQMAELRRMETMVYQSRHLTPDQKRERLDQINQLRIRYLDHAAPLLKLINDAR